MFDEIFDNRKVDDCNAPCGGADCVAISECSGIVDIIFEDDVTSENYGCVVNIIFGPDGNSFHFIDSEDDQGQYNQEPTRDGRKVSYEHTITSVCEGLSKSNTQLANAIKNECCLYAVVYHNNCLASFVGIQFNSKTGNWEQSRVKLTGLIGLNTNLGTVSDAATLTLTATSSCAAPNLVEFEKEWLEGLV